MNEQNCTQSKADFIYFDFLFRFLDLSKVRVFEISKQDQIHLKKRQTIT